MAELVVNIPDELEEDIRRLDIDMSLLIERLVKHLEEEKEMIDWSVKLQRASRYGRYERLKERGLVA